MKPDIGITIDVDSPSFTEPNDKSLQHMNIAKNICDIHDIRHVAIKSNLVEEFYGEVHSSAIDNIVMSYALALQKGLDVYYMGSTFLFNEFAFYGADQSQFELFCSKYFSNENLEIYSIGSEVTRLDKTKFIAQFDEPRHYLHPCSATDTKDNCNRCSKCTRTMVTLWILGKLEDYDEVFDVKSFYSDINYHLGYIIMRRENHFNKELIEFSKEYDRPIGLSAWFSAFFKWAKRGFRATNPHAEGFRPKEW